ncbi:MAG: hypothetical protein QG567_733 [Campylobacterota bacterium]|nr:hypothetical protein [Campylobacterota bacterium]MDQ1339581.1 hypothetical protein [Campylobacterota bacterium]
MLETIEKKLDELKEELVLFKSHTKYKLYQHSDAIAFCVNFIIFSNKKEHIQSLPEKELKKINSQLLLTIEELKSLRS